MKEVLCIFDFSENSNLKEIFLDYLYNLFKFSLVNLKNFQKISCLIEIGAYHFKKCMNQGFTYDKSFENFKTTLT